MTLRRNLAMVFVLANSAAACRDGNAMLRIEGTVIAAGTASPIANAFVAVGYRPESPFDVPVVATYTDASGRYTFDRVQVPCRDLTITAAAPGFAPSFSTALQCQEELQHFDFVLARDAS